MQLLVSTTSNSLSQEQKALHYLIFGKEGAFQKQLPDVFDIAVGGSVH